MIENLPVYISVVFGLTTLATLLLFYQAMKKSSVSSTRDSAPVILLALTGWLLVQAFLTLNKVYNSAPTAIPPKILLFGILPPIVTIILVFVTAKGRQFIDSLPLLIITYMNSVRVAVELIFIGLLAYKAIPELMTFEGRNFDILAGLTAPAVAYWGLTKRKLDRRVILGWNLICLALLINIVINALLSAPSPLQRFAFDQPNIAILNFPFSWLPTFIVPIILLGHFTSIRQLLNRKM